ncbi:thioredoxin domain-containing protein [Guyparkeria hydrothermalis]|uniref:thioredoxin domain-containing protein n=1 Tax=Guyparkeria hydrothermalis TaxID=923 RepID=UPI002021D15C|nr:thioredoxin domain-containing protein [Guyparkeria hydrothermalis]MCL7743546.1 thioredoxin domain-containing protein [Guyparkeria hydrothermalis]
MTNPRMQNATSPYLQAHADNPVEWREWSPETLELAREQDRPILLSIGYAACHWCHVMARESFSDPDIAAVMNRYFVNIKVDREERPDLDKTFQTAHALLNQRGGGWPLTAFLNPDDLSPFFIGTYFPAEPRFGMPGFADLLGRVHSAYREKGDQTRQQGAAVHQALTSAPPGSESVPPVSIADAARARLEGALDDEHGGLGGAPKFPQLPLLDFMLDEAASHGGDGSGRLDHAVAALLDGGLFDHLGGGIFRYCVDADWTIPHFEKMLVDNAQLPATLARFATLGRDDGRRAVIERLLDRSITHFLHRMQLPDGTFAASLDADTQGEEGATYLWTPDEARGVLEQAGVDTEMIDAFTSDYGLDRPANFEGRWHLAAVRRADRVADIQPIDEAVRAALLERRARRAQPKRDDKSLLGLNALLATGLMRAGARLGREDWAAMGMNLLDRLIPVDVAVADLPTGRLGERESVPAFLDDYAAVLEAQSEAFFRSPDTERLDMIEAIVEVVRERFGDETGAFRLSHDGHGAPVGSLVVFTDDAQPSGNAILADTLARLGYALGRTDWLDMAEGIFKAAGGSLDRAPQVHPRLLAALRRFHQPATLVVIKAHDMSSWQAAIDDLRGRGIAVLALGNDDLPADKPLPKGEGGLAYICRGTACLPPESDPARLIAQFD